LKAPTEPGAFIAWENRQRDRYQLLDGEVRLMAGGSRAHDLVAVNLLPALRSAMRRAACDVHGSNLKLVSPVGMVTYPDLFVRCGGLADEATECADPVVVIEVLSPSTRGEDLVRKRWGYQAMPSLAHLVYVDATQVKIEVATRDADGSWRSLFLDRMDQPVRLEAIDAEVGIADVYAGTRAAG
jgi:Uma2 family endonuclease